MEIKAEKRICRKNWPGRRKQAQATESADPKKDRAARIERRRRQTRRGARFFYRVGAVLSASSKHREPVSRVSGFRLRAPDGGFMREQAAASDEKSAAAALASPCVPRSAADSRPCSCAFCAMWPSLTNPADSFVFISRRRICAAFFSPDAGPENRGRPKKRAVKPIRALDRVAASARRAAGDRKQNRSDRPEPSRSGSRPRCRQRRAAWRREDRPARPACPEK